MPPVLTFERLPFAVHTLRVSLTPHVKRLPTGVSGSDVFPSRRLALLPSYLGWQPPLAACLTVGFG